MDELDLRISEEVNDIVRALIATSEPVATVKVGQLEISQFVAGLLDSRNNERVIEALIKEPELRKLMVQVRHQLTMASTSDRPEWVRKLLGQAIDSYRKVSTVGVDLKIPSVQALLREVERVVLSYPNAPSWSTVRSSTPSTSTDSIDARLSDGLLTVQVQSEIPLSLKFHVPNGDVITLGKAQPLSGVCTYRLPNFGEYSGLEVISGELFSVHVDGEPALVTRRTIKISFSDGGTVDAEVMDGIRVINQRLQFAVRFAQDLGLKGSSYELVVGMLLGNIVVPIGSTILNDFNLETIRFESDPIGAVDGDLGLHSVLRFSLNRRTD